MLPPGVAVAIVAAAAAVAVVAIAPAPVLLLLLEEFLGGDVRPATLLDPGVSLKTRCNQRTMPTPLAGDGFLADAAAAVMLHTSKGG
jgi:hypothetical protein